MAPLAAQRQALEFIFVPGKSFVASDGFSAVSAQLLGARVVDESGPLFPAIAFSQQVE